MRRQNGEGVRRRQQIRYAKQRGRAERVSRDRANETGLTRIPAWID
jgi:hypothetical protein